MRRPVGGHVGARRRAGLFAIRHGRGGAVLAHPVTEVRLGDILCLREEGQSLGDYFTFASMGSPQGVPDGGQCRLGPEGRLSRGTRPCPASAPGGIARVDLPFGRRAIQNIRPGASRDIVWAGTPHYAVMAVAARWVIAAAWPPPAACVGRPKQRQAFAAEYGRPLGVPATHEQLRDIARFFRGAGPMTPTGRGKWRCR